MSHRQLKSETFPLNRQQEEIYIDFTNSDNKALFNIGGYVDIRNSINEKLLEIAIGLSIEENPILKSAITLKGLKPVHIIKESNFQLQVFDYSSGNPEEKSKIHIDNEFCKEFCLDEGQLYKVGLIKISEERFWLYFISHHIIIDGAGYANWIRKIFELYQQLSLGKTPLDSRDKTFLHIAGEHATKTNAKRASKSSLYWNQIFHQLPDVPFHPLNNSTCPRKSSSKIVLTIPPLEYSSLLEKAADKNLAVLPLFLTAISTLVNRINDTDALVIGTPLHNRTSKEQRGMIGAFMSMMPVKLSYSGDQLISDAVKQTSQLLKSGFRNREYPLSALYRDLGLLRQGRKRLYDVAFNYQQIDFDFSEYGVNARTHYLSHGQEEVPLTVTLCEYGDKQPTELQLDYRHDFFSAAHAQGLLDSIFVLVQGMIEQPDISLNSLNLVGQEQAKKLIELGQSKTTVEQPFISACEMFEHQVVANPDATAVISGEYSLTYEALNARANQLARRLRTLGAGADSLVAICLPRSIDMIVSILAVLKSGAAYLPIDTSYPKQRIHYMLSDAAPRVVISSKTLQADLALDSENLLLTEHWIDGLVQYSDQNLSCEQSGNAKRALAYVIYTSGTTGEPKGVMVEHGQLSSFVNQIKHSYKLSPSDRMLQFSSIGFDIAVEECFGALCHGAALVLRNEEIVNDIGAFWQFCQQNMISVISLPTAFWHQLMEVGKAPISTSLRLVILGGEALKYAKACQWFELTQSIELLNTYGPTETTVTACSYSMRGAPQGGQSVPIGQANINTQLYVLDKHMQMVPYGAKGELYIGGDGVARGYLNRPQQTRQVFVEDPIKPGRLYRTGDIVRFQFDNNLEFISRNDDQVKIRGFRVEPQEVSEQLLKLPEISDAIVHPRKLENEQLQLIAYVTGEKPIKSTEIIAQLKLSLADYMTPAAVVQVPEFPFTQNGKIAYDQLPVPKAEDFYVREYIAPQGEIETLLANSWSRLLGIDLAGRLDNFFELGGHSLLVSRLVLELNRECGIELTVSDVFKAKTLSQLAQTIEQKLLSKTIADEINELDNGGWL
ncbi:non-ribosomal peptide synthetase [Pseudoalteromonas rubra]|uniref:Carrier domain-containing protein n=1 Tax=Pseudoalteromonas rubra TaxID=43658 RepID=A0A0F4QV55_9GAMM|nr:non-ribosomal peptide synthetase [Pseudoalteromonas rubra]KJZ11130.1 hypothetical protein TW77_06305 [Pseudoalteromonas rubra]